MGKFSNNIDLHTADNVLGKGINNKDYFINVEIFYKTRNRSVWVHMAYPLQLLSHGNIHGLLVSSFCYRYGFVTFFETRVAEELIREVTKF